MRNAYSKSKKLNSAKSKELSETNVATKNQKSKDTEVWNGIWKSWSGIQSQEFKYYRYILIIYAELK